MYKKATQKFMDAMKAPNRAMVIVKALSIDGTTTTIPVVSGTVTVDRTSSQFRRSIDFTTNLPYITNPDGSIVNLIPQKDTDPLNIYGQHIYAYRGVVWNLSEIDPRLFTAPAPLDDQWLRPANGAYELVPIGVFRINSVTISEDKDGDVSIEVSGTDVSNNIGLNHWTNPTTVYTKPYTVPVAKSDTTKERNYIAGTVTEAIKILIQDRWPTHPGVFGPPEFDFSGVQDVPIKHPIIMGSTNVSNSGSNSPWTDISGLAASLGGGRGELFVNAEGKFQTLSIPDPNAVPPVWEFLDGDNNGNGGLLTNVSRVLSDSKTVNYVIATGEATSAKTPLKAVAVDDDPTSPTNYLGTFGRVVGYEPGRKLLKTQAQVQNAADTFLSWFTGGNEALTIEGAVNPALDVNDVIAVRRKRLGIFDPAATVAVLSSQIFRSKTYTTLNVVPLQKDITSGEQLVIYTDYITQNITLSHPARKGDKLIQVNPFTPSSDFLASTNINDPKVIANGGAVNYYIDKLVIPLDLTTALSITARERRTGTRKDAIRLNEYSQVNPNNA